MFVIDVWFMQQILNTMLRVILWNFFFQNTCFFLTKLFTMVGCCVVSLIGSVRRKHLSLYTKARRVQVSGRELLPVHWSASTRQQVSKQGALDQTSLKHFRHASCTRIRYSGICQKTWQCTRHRYQAFAQLTPVTNISLRPYIALTPHDSYTSTSFF